MSSSSELLHAYDLLLMSLEGTRVKYLLLIFQHSFDSQFLHAAYWLKKQIVSILEYLTSDMPACAESRQTKGYG